MVVVAGVLHYVGANAVAIFVVSAAALAGLAWVIAIATETVGERFGPAVTGVLQSTLGNLPELFVVLFAVSAGELVVAKTSIVGSLLANALLVLGLSIAAGARAAPDGVMSFKPRLPNDTATLLLLAVFVIALLGVSDQVGDRASNHQFAISVVGAVCLLVVYGAWLWSYLRSDEPPAAEAGAARPHVSFRFAIGLLAAGGVAAALVSDWFVAALDPAVEAIGISKAFTGLVIVGDRRQRGRERRRHLARRQAAVGPRHLGHQELGRADRGLPLPAARPALAVLLLAPDVRAQPDLRDRARADGDRRLADHRETARP